MSIAEKVGKYAYVPSHVQFFRNKGQYFARGAKKPQPGDIIFFKDECHVGLVEYAAGGYVHTIEGNTSGGSTLIDNGGGVHQKCYPLGSSYIQGYGRPGYAAGEAARIISVALNEVGYLEKASNAYLDDKTANAGRNNYTRYARDIWPSLQAQPWCDIFVSWCAIQADKAAYQPGWDKNDTGWWYVRQDGSYPKSAWEQVDGKWYYFNEEGYMETNKWITSTGAPYYVGDDGAMVTNRAVRISENGDLVPAGAYYYKLSEVPPMYREVLDKLIADGKLKGREGTGEDLVLDMSEEMVRALVIMNR